MARLFVTTLVLFGALALATRPVVGAVPDVHAGEIGGAPYRIQMPADWGGGLVMFAHGYHPRGVRWSPLSDSRARVFLERGFALAQSGYSRQGWAVAEALVETEAVRQRFVEQFGEPKTTFIVGYSMGGLIAVATLETHPDRYDGALSVCGPLLPALEFLKDPTFDMLVTFEALFGDALPEAVRPLIEAPHLSAEVVEQALRSDSELATEFATRWDIRRRDLAEILSFYHLIIRELMERAGGNPIDNRDTVYAGLGPVPDLNESVRRYRADPAALDYLRRNFTLKGAIEDPVLAIHTSYDPGVPPRLVNCYDLTLALVGKQDLFVHQFVLAEGHCNVPADLLGKAFDQLCEWAAGGTPAPAGVLR